MSTKNGIIETLKLTSNNNIILGSVKINKNIKIKNNINCNKFIGDGKYLTDYDVWYNSNLNNIYYLKGNCSIGTKNNNYKLNVQGDCYTNILYLYIRMYIYTFFTIYTFCFIFNTFT